MSSLGRLLRSLGRLLSGLMAIPIKVIDRLFAGMETVVGAIQRAWSVGWAAFRDHVLHHVLFYLILSISCIKVCLKATLEELDRIVAALERGFIAIALLVMSILYFLMYFSREVVDLDIPSDGMAKWSVTLMVWVGFLGASLATRRRSHLAVDATDRILSPRVARLVKRFTSLAAAVFCWRFVDYAVAAVDDNLVRGLGLEALPLLDWMVGPINLLGDVLFGDGGLTSATQWLIGLLIICCFVESRRSRKAAEAVLPLPLPDEDPVEPSLSPYRMSLDMVAGLSILMLLLSFIGDRWTPSTEDEPYYWDQVQTSRELYRSNKAVLDDTLSGLGVGSVGELIEDDGWGDEASGDTGDSGEVELPPHIQAMIDANKAAMGPGAAGSGAEAPEEEAETPSELATPTEEALPAEQPAEEIDISALVGSGDDDFFDDTGSPEPPEAEATEEEPAEEIDISALVGSSDDDFFDDTGSPEPPEAMAPPELATVAEEPVDPAGATPAAEEAGDAAPLAEDTTADGWRLHTVGDGGLFRNSEPLRQIADKYEVEVEAILEANPAARNGLQPGMELDIPPLPPRYHTVEAGESLKDIASKYDTIWEEIVEANLEVPNVGSLEPDTALKAGSVLRVPRTVLPEQIFPVWLIQAVLPLSFLFMAVRFGILAFFGRFEETLPDMKTAGTAKKLSDSKGPRDLLFAGLIPGLILGIAAALGMETGPLIFLASILLLFIGAPLFLIVGVAVVACVTMLKGAPGDTIVTDMFEAVKKEEFLAIPFFVLAGNIMTQGSIAERLVGVAKAIMGRTPGGLGLATVAACVIFAAISGSSPVTVIAVGGIMFPMLMKDRYPENYSIGVLTSAGSLGIIIPPSVPMIIYAIVVGMSISQIDPACGLSPNDLFLAGVLPGLFIAFILVVYTLYQTRPGRQDVKIQAPVLEGGYWRNLFRELRRSVPSLLLPVLILGGIYGVLGPLRFTVTEAAAVAVIYALFVELVVNRELKLSKLPKVFADSGVMMGGLFLIIVLAIAFNKFLTWQQVPQDAAEWLSSIIDTKLEFILLVNIFLLALGCVMDIISAILIVAPLLAPIALTFGIDPIHFGIIFIVNLELGYLTPPMGINLFVSSTVFKKGIVKVIKSTAPFFLLMLFCLGIISMAPDMSTSLLKPDTLENSDICIQAAQSPPVDEVLDSPAEDIPEP